MMLYVARYRLLSSAAGRGALALLLLFGAAACDTTATTDQAASFVLNTRGEPVLANSPPGIELTLGSKQVLQAGAPSGLE
jgi:hypothetical protein